MNNKNALLLAVIALGAIVVFKYMAGQMVPYVPFTQAMESGEYVQIIGKIDKEKGVSRQAGSIRFLLLDETAKSGMTVDYSAEQPLQLEQAEKIVVIGSYDKANGLFNADKILTKCPSKYENK
ncbi:MAG: cytochrome c maturation protein CcmE [Spirochaetota bacterium]